MLMRFVTPEIVLAVLIFSPLTHSQTAPPQSGSAKDQKEAPAAPVTADVDDWGHPITAPVKGQMAAPAPRHDISGIWDPGMNAIRVLGTLGASAMPEDGKPEHQLPFTPLGLKTWKEHKPGFGTTEVAIALNNDPFDSCDPIGFPRIELFNLRAIQIVQNPKQVLIFYQNDRTFRSIWADGRGFPSDDISEPRWYGYSTGKWEDDATFVVETTGLDEVGVSLTTEVSCRNLQLFELVRHAQTVRTLVPIVN